MQFNNLLFAEKPGSISVHYRSPNPGAILEIRQGSLEGRVIARCLFRASKPNEELQEWEVQQFELSGDCGEKEKLYFVFRGETNGLEIKSFSFR